jgi:hypothetical protein
MTYKLRIGRQGGGQVYFRNGSKTTTYKLGIGRQEEMVRYTSGMDQKQLHTS